MHRSGRFTSRQSGGGRVTATGASAARDGKPHRTIRRRQIRRPQFVNSGHDSRPSHKNLFVHDLFAGAAEARRIGAPVCCEQARRALLVSHLHLVPAPPSSATSTAFSRHMSQPIFHEAATLPPQPRLRAQASFPSTQKGRRWIALLRPPSPKLPAPVSLSGRYLSASVRFRETLPSAGVCISARGPKAVAPVFSRSDVGQGRFEIVVRSTSKRPTQSPALARSGLCSRQP